MMYDPTRDVYHVMYQWHPYHINWGESSCLRHNRLLTGPIQEIYHGGKIMITLYT